MDRNRQAAALAVGENFEIDRFADMSAPTFRTILYLQRRAQAVQRAPPDVFGT